MDVRFLPQSEFSRYKQQKISNAQLLYEDQVGLKNIVRGYPNYLYMITDELCNFRCPTCIQKLRVAARREPSVIDRKYLIKFAKEVFPSAMVLQLNTAGEPLVSRVLDLELSLADEYGLKLDIFTNGHFLNPKEKKLRLLFKNLKLVTFSIDSPVKRTYQFIRRGGDFTRLVKNIRAFQAYRKRLSVSDRPFFSINMVVMKRNLHELSRMVYFAKEVGADEIVLSRLFVYEKSMQKESLETDKINSNLAMMGAWFLAHRLGIRITMSSLFSVERSQNNLSEQACSDMHVSKKTKICPFLWSSVYLDTEANIVPCCAPPHPIVGGIKDSDFKSIWNSPVYQSMRSTFTNGSGNPICQACRESGLLSTLDF